MATIPSQSGTLDRRDSLLAAAIPLARRMARPLLVPYIAVSLGTWLLGSSGGGAGGAAVPFAVVAIVGAATSNSTLLFAGQGLYMPFALYTGFGFELF